MSVENKVRDSELVPTDGHLGYIWSPPLLSSTPARRRPHFGTFSDPTHYGTHSKFYGPGPQMTRSGTDAQKMGMVRIVAIFSFLMLIY